MILPKAKTIWKNKEYERFIEMWKRGYSPLNFDADDVFSAIRIGIKLLIRFRNVEYRVSSSGRGLHFRVLDENGNVLYLPSERVFRIREEIGDDPGRLFWDRIKLKVRNWRPISVLFDTKNGKRAGEWKRLTLEDLIEFAKNKFLCSWQ